MPPSVELSVIVAKVVVIVSSVAPLLVTTDVTVTKMVVALGVGTVVEIDKMVVGSAVGRDRLGKTCDASDATSAFCSNGPQRSGV